MRMCLSNADDITDEYVYIDCDTIASKMEGVKKKDGKNRKKNYIDSLGLAFAIYFIMRFVLFFSLGTRIGQKGKRRNGCCFEKNSPYSFLPSLTSFFCYKEESCENETAIIRN